MTELEEAQIGLATILLDYRDKQGKGDYTVSDAIKEILNLKGENWRIAIVSDAEILALKRPNIREVIWQAGE